MSARMRIWATVDTEGEFRAIQHQAKRAADLTDAALARKLEVDEHHPDGGYLSISVEGSDAEIHGLACQIHSDFGEGGWTVDVDSEATAHWLAKHKGLYGEIHFEDFAEV